MLFPKIQTLSLQMYTAKQTCSDKSNKSGQKGILLVDKTTCKSVALTMHKGGAKTHTFQVQNGATILDSPVS